MIDPLGEAISIELSGTSGNTSIWYHASTFELRSSEGRRATLYEEDLGVDEAYRGQDYAQTVVGNTVYLAHRLGVRRVKMTAQDVGAHMWARAGALPLHWLEIARPVLANADTLLRSGKIDAVEHKVIFDLVQKGSQDRTLIRPLAGLRRTVEAVGGRNVSIGAKLLVGANWQGEIELTDLITRRTFQRWRRSVERAKAQTRRRDDNPLERSREPMR